VAIFPELRVFQSLIDFPCGKFGLTKERPATVRKASRAAAAGSFGMSSIAMAPGMGGGTPRIVTTNDRPRIWATRFMRRSASARFASNTVSALSRTAPKGRSAALVSMTRKSETSSPVGASPSASTSLATIARGSVAVSREANMRRRPKRSITRGWNSAAVATAVCPSRARRRPAPVCLPASPRLPI
jgi:hypothetical protein